MTALEYRNVLATKLIREFASHFKEQTGLYINIHCNDEGLMSDLEIARKDNSLPVMSLKTLEELILKNFSHKISNQQFMSNNRARGLVDCRCYFTHFARRFNFTYASIGQYLGRHHTTVMHLHQRANNYLETEPSFVALYNKLEKIINYEYAKTIQQNYRQKDNS